MVYHAMGLMSGSSLDGLDIVYAQFHEQGGQWSYTIEQSACYPYSSQWEQRLRSATALTAAAYCQLHVDYGHFLGQQVNRFIEENQLQFKVGLVGSHGHTVFHAPQTKLTTQLGEGAALAAVTSLPVVTDLRTMDLAFGGQGAPLVPMGERALFSAYSLLLNLGGIANVTSSGEQYVAYDVCPANRVLNLLANQLGQSYDEDGKCAASGKVIPSLLTALEAHPYYQQPYPKSLANEMGTDEHFTLLVNSGHPIQDLLATYTTHVANQVAKNVLQLASRNTQLEQKMLVTGGGALNSYLVSLLREKLQPSGIEIVVPATALVQFKEALIMAFLAVLRWRQEYTTLSSVTGAKRASIGGALWNGQEA